MSEGALTVFNLGTQRTWRTRAELDAIERSVRTMIALAEERGVRSIGLPRIGAGLGGLAWSDVRALLSRLGESSRVELVVFEEYVAAAASSRSAPKPRRRR